MRSRSPLVPVIGILLVGGILPPTPEVRAAESTSASFSTQYLDVRDWQRGVAVADLDRNGRDEIVVSSDLIDCQLPVVGSGNAPTAAPCVARERVRVFRDGTTLSQSWLVPAHPAPLEILAGDLNRDQYPDLVSTYPGSLEIRYNDGTGLFGAPEGRPGPGPGYLAIADFDGDTHNDLLALATSGVGMVFRSIDPDSLEPDSLSLGGIGQVAVVDANRDGDPDLAVTVEAAGGYRLRLFPGIAGADFGPPIVGPLVGYSIVAGDFDRDGIPDIVDNQGRFFRGAGDGTFAASALPAPALAAPPVSAPAPRDAAGTPANPVLPGSLDDITAVDINRDGSLDLVTRVSQPMVNLRFGRGDGTFLAPLSVATEPNPWLIGSGRFNADDDPDLVVLSYQGNYATLLMNGGGWPTATSILDARATRDGSVVDLRWTVGAENTRNLYAVLRGPEDRRERLTHRPLTGRASFQWRDEHPLSGAAEYWIEETTPSGASDIFGPIAIAAGDVGSENAAMAVGLPHPNPSRGAVAVSLTLPAPGVVRIELHDVHGARRGTLMDDELPAGTHELRLDPRSLPGGRLAAGRYWLRITSGRAITTRGLLLLD
jgi:hypothetical protein